jgi:predicted metal-binding membrane protein
VAERKAQRAARRTRRTVAIVCGVVVAVCLILTILIVNMARTRTSAPGVAVNPVDPVALSIGPPGPVAVTSFITHHPTLGAQAPEGDNP